MHQPDAPRPLSDFLKQIVYGGNDGIVTTFAVVSGFAGAAAEGVEKIGPLAVLVFGFANLVADAVSMGLGEFLSTRSQRDLYTARRRETAAALAADPAAARADLAHLLRQRGLPSDDAALVADRIARAPDLATDIAMSGHQSLPDMRQATPAADGLATFAAFLVFGIVPLLPYLLLPATAPGTFGLSVAATVAALTALGLLRWHTTGEGPVRALAETLAVGSTCAAVAYLVGALIGG